ncbi:dipeptide ABC transporter ATP-binding protein [Oceanibium sediminis]|uniref:dipeptide ABC transporter ATP-binding protein n=1 Tax=Oceanibium sediminis TaxID=2026339 RepID=UPI000DD48284|nr:ABC transporter ATP-binding protein [Oceanibium sediminis]
MSEDKTVLCVRDLTVGLDNDPAARILDGISFDLKSGEILGLIGEAGSGKTVLARALVKGLGAPLVTRSGAVHYKGADLLGLSERKLSKIRGKEIGYIGANPQGSLDPTIPVGNQIVEKLLSVSPGMSRKAATERALEVLAAVRIPSPEVRFHEYPFQFSGGMMQRVMIVDALVTNPAVLIADNITQPLDVTVAAQIIRLIRDLREQFSTAILFISSSLPVAETVADEVMVLQSGRIVEKATPTALVQNPQHDYTKSLLSRLPRIWGEGISGPEAADTRTLMTVEDVHRTYFVRKKGSFRGVNAVQAVRGVTLDIREGENIGIVGESGCGKSTLTRLLAWLESPQAGSIRFAGQDLSKLGAKDLTKLRQSFQLLLQDPYSSLPSRMPIGRIIAEPLLIHGLCKRSEIRGRVLAAMREVGLDPALENQLTVGLSAGQRQRINIARALVLEPRLMILDETLSALDQVEQSKLFEVFDRLQKTHGFTYIFISHDMALVRKVCHRVAVMYLGRIVEFADNNALFDNPAHPYSRALLSAVPTLDDHPFSSDEYLLEGEPPSPVHIPPGCSFRSRCPLAQEICGRVDPVAQVLPGGGSAMCHLVGQDAPARSLAAGK